MLATDRKLPLSGGLEKRSYVREMFTAIAPRYDFLNHLLSLNVDRRWRRQAVAELDWPARPDGPVASGQNHRCSFDCTIFDARSSAVKLE